MRLLLGAFSGNGPKATLEKVFTAFTFHHGTGLGCIWYCNVLHLCARTFFGHSRPGKHKPNKFGKKAPERANVSEEHSIFGNPLPAWEASEEPPSESDASSSSGAAFISLKVERSQEAPLQCSHCTSLHFRGRTRGALWCTKC